jgi:hypothetical protein
VLNAPDLEGAIFTDLSYMDESNFPSITISDLKLALHVIDISSERGAFKGSEMKGIGILRGKLHDLIKANKLDDSDNDGVPQAECASPGISSLSGYMRLHEISEYLEETYDADCVIIQNGAFYEAFKTSAEYLNINYDYKLFDSLSKDQLGQTFLKAGFPILFGYEHLKGKTCRLIVVNQTAEYGNRGTLVREIADAVNISSEIIGLRLNEKGVVAKPKPIIGSKVVSEPNDSLDTFEVTAYYFLKGLTVREIAKERGLKNITITKHFHTCAERKLLTKSDVFPDEEKDQRIEELISMHPEWRPKRLFQELDEDTEYYQIYYVMGALGVPLKDRGGSDYGLGTRSNDSSLGNGGDGLDRLIQ